MAGHLDVLREIAFDAPSPASARAAEIGAAHLLPAGFDPWFGHCVAIDIDARVTHARAAFTAFDALNPSG